jgi:hypothetical protein
MEDDPYLPPKAQPLRLIEAARLSEFLPSFASSILLTPIAFFFFGAIAGRPDFLLRPRFLVALAVCSSASALLLKFYRSANWLVRSILAPPITFALMLFGIVALRLVAA